MSKDIDEYIFTKSYTSAVKECIALKQYNLGLLLGKIITEEGKCVRSNFKRLNDQLDKMSLSSDNTVIHEVTTMIETPNKIRVKMYCNWCTSQELCELWDRMSKGDRTWNNIEIVWDDPADYYVVINSPPIGTVIQPNKTIVFITLPLPT